MASDFGLIRSHYNDEGSSMVLTPAIDLLSNVGKVAGRTVVKANNADGPSTIQEAIDSGLTEMVLEGTIVVTADVVLPPNKHYVFRFVNNAMLKLGSYVFSNNGTVSVSLVGKGTLHRDSSRTSWVEVVMNGAILVDGVTLDFRECTTTGFYLNWNNTVVLRNCTYMVGSVVGSGIYNSRECIIDNVDFIGSNTGAPVPGHIDAYIRVGYGIYDNSVIRNLRISGYFIDMGASQYTLDVANTYRTRVSNLTFNLTRVNVRMMLAIDVDNMRVLDTLAHTFYLSGRGTNIVAPYCTLTLKNSRTNLDGVDVLTLVESGNLTRNMFIKNCIIRGSLRDDFRMGSGSIIRDTVFMSDLTLTNSIMFSVFRNVHVMGDLTAGFAHGRIDNCVIDGDVEATDTANNVVLNNTTVVGTVKIGTGSIESCTVGKLEFVGSTSIRVSDTTITAPNNTGVIAGANPHATFSDSKVTFTTPITAQDAFTGAGTGLAPYDLAAGTLSNVTGSYLTQRTMDITEAYTMVITDRCDTYYLMDLPVTSGASNFILSESTRHISIVVGVDFSGLSTTGKEAWSIGGTTLNIKNVVTGAFTSGAAFTVPIGARKGAMLELFQSTIPAGATTGWMGLWTP